MVVAGVRARGGPPARKEDRRSDRKRGPRGGAGGRRRRWRSSSARASRNGWSSPAFELEEDEQLEADHRRSGRQRSAPEGLAAEPDGFVGLAIVVDVRPNGDCELVRLPETGTVAHTELAAGDGDIWVHCNRLSQVPTR